MREGKQKQLLYKTRIIPIYSRLLQFRYEKKKKKLQNPDRWYFKLLPIKKNKLIFANFFGNGYGDNPKAITDEILRQGLQWDLVWISKLEKTDFPEGVRVVKYGTTESYKEMATAKLWVFNIRNFPHPAKRKKQVYLQTWHGGGVVLKKLEGMIEDNLSKNYVKSAKLDGAICDYILSSDAIRSEVERDYFWLNKKTKILEFGTPRDDVFYNKKMQDYYRKHVRELYHIDSNTKIVLYMPTFRDDGNTSCYDLDYSGVIEAFEKRFVCNAVVFSRLHPNVPKGTVIIPQNHKIIDVTDYPEAYELFLAVDFAISDYNSSAICKMPLLNKPSFIFASDYEDYIQMRGLTKYYKEIPIQISKTNNQLIQQIMGFNEKEYFSAWAAFHGKYPSFERGTASQQVVDIIQRNIINQ